MSVDPFHSLICHSKEYSSEREALLQSEKQVPELEQRISEAKRNLQDVSQQREKLRSEVRGSFANASSVLTMS